MDPNAKVDAPQEPAPKEGSGKKSNKKKKSAQEKAQLDQDALKLVQEKLNEIKAQQQTPAEDLELKELRRQYKRLSKALKGISEDQTSQPDKQQILLEAANKLQNELNFRYQEEAVLLRKIYNLAKQEKDTGLQKEFTQLQDNKNRIEAQCREYESKINQINQFLVSIPIDEGKKREEIKQNFYSNFTDVKQKIQQQEEEALAFESENKVLKEELDVMIKGYEEKEKEFWEKVRQKESDQKNESQKYLEKFEIMQQSAQKAIQAKLTYETQGKLIQQKHMKLQLCKKQFSEFIETMDKSHTTLIRLKEELIKMAMQNKAAEEKHAIVSKRADQSDKAILSIITKNNDIKDQISAVKASKEVLKTQILAVQAQLKEQQEKAAAEIKAQQEPQVQTQN